MSSSADPSSGAISLPTGGGALQGLGEKFSPDLHTGTGNFSIPISVPHGRNGVQPTLALTYSSGSGNGPFGLGWSLGAPMISRKTSAGVPRYRDGAADVRKHDTFLLSGSEDLVPVRGGAAGVRRYRPRTEGLFARIERHEGPDRWEVRTHDGMLSVYGGVQDDEVGATTLADPAAPGRVFGWKLTETRDPFGNLVRYEYLRDAGSDDFHHWDQLYLRRVLYADHEQDGETRFLVSVELEYEDRPDPFSDHRAGFEIRTRKRCRRIVVRTHADVDRRVRTYEMVYLDALVERGELPAAELPANGVSLLARVQVTGHDGDRDEALPPIELGYTRFRPEGRDFFPLTGRDLPARSLAGRGVELVDLFGNGLPALVEMGESVRYWKNRGDGTFDLPRPMADAPAGLRLGEPGVQIVDANGDGRADLLVSRGSVAGYFPLRSGGEWDRRSFRAYDAAPTFALDDPEVRLVDLDGDGVTDAIRSGARLECFFNDADAGWTESRGVERRALSLFPDVTFSDPRVRFADMSGDGLQDMVVVRDGSVEYWPAQGWGDWGRRVTMRRSPRLPDGYDPRRILLGDVDGDGCADLVYVDDTRVTLWINRCGNGWSEPVVIHGTPSVADGDAVRIADVMGVGIAGLLWSFDAGRAGRERMVFLQLAGEPKPYLLNRMANNTGAVTEVEYAPSTRCYLDDLARGIRWKTPLPFPVQVVRRSVAIDAISGGRLTTEYTYHHGYWDGAEREFRGFGRVDQRDTETFDDFRAAVGDASAAAARSYSPPQETRTWYHQGPVGDEHGEWTEPDYSAEFWPGDAPCFRRPAEMEEALAALPRRARRDALRTLRGRVLRTESYALDGPPLETVPFTVTEQLHAVREEDAPDPDGPDRERIFFPHTLAQRTTRWERGDDPLTQLQLTGDHDAFGQPRTQAAVAAPRGWRPAPGPSTATEAHLVTLTRTEYAARTEGAYLVRPTRVTAWEVPGLRDPDVQALRERVLGGTAPRVLLGDSVTRYDGPAFEGLPAGELGGHGAAVRTETLAMTDAQVAEAYGSRVPPYLAPGAPAWTDEYPPEFRAALPARAGYVRRALPGGGEGWYVVAGSSRYDFQSGAARPRGLVLAVRDALGHEGTTVYDAYAVLPVQTADALGNVIRATYDYRVLQPREITDPNGNVARVAYTPLGLPESVAALGRPGDGVGDTPEAPGTRFVYDHLAWVERRQPLSVRTVRRVHHATDTQVPLPERDALLEGVEFTDGFGRLLQTRARAEDVVFGALPMGDAGLPAQFAAGPGVATGTARPDGAPPRVVVSGWQVYDNKGRVVEKYEPFFAEGWGFAAPGEAERGRRAVMHYDAAGRVVRTVFPDGAEQRVVFGTPPALGDPDVFRPSPWVVFTYDAADNAGRTHPAAPDAWREHRDTPSSTETDALGRVVRATARNGRDPATQWLTVRTRYDVRGNVLEVRDELGRLAARTRYDMAGRPLWTEHPDAGARTTVPDAAGSPVETRDARGALTLHAYDALNRPVRLWARDGAAGRTTLRQRLEYGEALGAAQARAGNLRGRLHRHHDEAGVLVFEAYDFRGNPVEQLRRTLSDAEVLTALDAARPGNGWALEPYRVEWTPPAGIPFDTWAAAKLETAEHRTSLRYDALGRVASMRLPRDAAGGRGELRPRYNRAGALERVELDGAPYMERIAYNARGQRVLEVLGNGVMTRYAYHPDTFRLARLRTDRVSRSGGPLVYAPATPDEPLQDLVYETDLAGSTLRMEDRTPGSGVANNPEAVAEADPVLRALLIAGNALVRRFEYDALGRLLSATGRQCKVIPNPRPWADDLRCEAGFRDTTLPSRDNAPRVSILYRERYAYDPSGNLVSLAHRNADASWTRAFGVGGLSPRAWAAAWPAHLDGADWNGAPGNRLTHASDLDPAGPATHVYDAAGNLVRETTSRRLDWDHAGRLVLFRVQPEGAKPSVYGFYLYDAAGQRVKKITGKQGAPADVTVYLDAMEQRRVGSHECSEIHVMDGTRRIAMVRVGRPLPGDNSPPVRYHLGDHLGSSVLVVDGTGAWVSREEHTPWGETTLGSFAKKRYRFTGKERDEESGLYYHGARYYAPWLCRWTRTDPAGMVDGLNLYAYVRNNPVKLSDPTGLAGEGGQEGAAMPFGRLGTLTEQSIDMHVKWRNDNWERFANPSVMDPEQSFTDRAGYLGNAVTTTLVGIPLSAMYVLERPMYLIVGLGWASNKIDQTFGAGTVEGIAFANPGPDPADAMLAAAPWARAVAGRMASSTTSYVKTVVPEVSRAVSSTSFSGLAWLEPVGQALLKRPGSVSYQTRLVAQGGLEELAALRSALNLPPPGPGSRTLARLDVGGKSFVGWSANNNKISLKVNPVSKFHAEADVFQQAYNAGAKGERATLYVDYPNGLCGACAHPGGVDLLAQQLGVRELTMVGPNFSYTYKLPHP